MPYMAVKRGDKWEVFKMGPDDMPEGEAMGEHESATEADAQVAALYAKDKPQESAKTRTGYFAELAELTEAVVSEDGASARVTLIQPGWSRNSRYYSRDVLKKAATLFEGGQAYADHPGKSESKDRPERSVRDIVGWYEGVKQEKDGRLTANLRIVQEWIKPIIRAAAKDNPQLAGLSINALGETRKGSADGREGIIVEAIVKHNSTDIVTTPAAGGRVEALLATDGDSFTHDLLEAMSLEELQETLREVRPDLVKAWKKEWQTPRDTEPVKAARAEVTTLKKQLAESKKEHRASKTALQEVQAELAALKKSALVDRLLADSKLPQQWKVDLRAQLLEAKDGAAMQVVLEREMAKAKAVPKPLAVRGNGLPMARPFRVNTAPVVSPIFESFGVKPTQATNYFQWLREQQTLKE